MPGIWPYLLSCHATAACLTSMMWNVTDAGSLKKHSSFYNINLPLAGSFCPLSGYWSSFFFFQFGTLASFMRPFLDSVSVKDLTQQMGPVGADVKIRARHYNASDTGCFRGRPVIVAILLLIYCRCILCSDINVWSKSSHLGFCERAGCYKDTQTQFKGVMKSEKCNYSVITHVTDSWHTKSHF